MTIEERIDCPKCKSEMCEHDDYYRGQAYYCDYCKITYTQSDLHIRELFEVIDKQSEALRVAVEALQRAKFDLDMAIEAGSAINIVSARDVKEALTKIEEMLR